MARPQVPDSTQFIRQLHGRDDLSTLYESIAVGRLYLSSVVVAELYAGTRSHAESLVLDRIVQASGRIDRILTPSAEDWALAGRLISRRVRLTGDLKPRDHLADVLLIASAARLKGEVLSANRRHMTVWIDLAQKAGLDVVLGD